MSRLALKGQSKPAKYGALGGFSKSQKLASHAATPSHRGTPALTAGGSSGSGGNTGAGAAAPTLSSDSWDSCGSDKDQDDGAHQDNPQPQLQLQPQPQPSRGLPTCRSGLPAGTPALPNDSQLAPASQRSHPISELYEISTSDSDDDPQPVGGPAAAVQDPAQHPPAATSAAAAQPGPGQPTGLLPGCPTCGCRLQGLTTEQRLQHANSCCDAAAGEAGRGAAPLSVQRQERLGPPTDPKSRPCYQQQQQPPAQRQQQQPSAPQQQEPQRWRQDPKPLTQGGGVQSATARVGHLKVAAVGMGMQPQARAQHAEQPAAAGVPQPQALAEATAAAAAAAAAGQAGQAGQQLACKVCGAGLHHLAVQQQVAHVKACMAGRGRGSAKLAKQPASLQPPPLPRQQQQQQQQLQQTQLEQQANRSLQHMDMGKWLKALGLERYLPVFEEQEIDLSCVHAVSAEELASIGIIDRLHQVRIVQAADALASQLGLRRLAAGSGAGGGGSNVGKQAVAAKRQKQLVLAAPPAPPGAAAVAPAAGAAAAGTVAGGQAGAAACAAMAGGQQQLSAYPQQLPGGSVYHGRDHQPADSSMRDAGARPEERALLARLYPPLPPPQQPQQQPAGGAGGGEGHPQQQQVRQSQQQQQQQQRTPQLAGGRTLARSSALAGGAAASLWAGAAACVPSAPTLGARLAQREAQDPEAAAANRQPLARGGTAYPVGEESRALKRVRLEALRHELRTHEETVAALRSMIAQLEREVGDPGASSSGGSGGGSAS